MAEHSLSENIQRVIDNLDSIEQVLATKGIDVSSVPVEEYASYMEEGIIDTRDATATSDDILATKTAYINGEKIIGTMPNNGELNFTPTTEEQIIPEGYTSGGIIEPAVMTQQEYNDIDLTLDLIIGNSIILPTTGLLFNFNNKLNNSTDKMINLVNKQEISINGTFDKNGYTFNNDNIDTKISQDDFSTKYTIAFRIKPTLWKGYVGILGYHRQNDGITFQCEGNTIAIGHVGRSTLSINTSVLPLDVWSLVVIEYDGTTLKVYVNDITEPIISKNIGSVISAGNLYLGRSYYRDSDSERCFVGQMSNFLLYSRNLSLEERQIIKTYIIQNI